MLAELFIGDPWLAFLIFLKGFLQNLNQSVGELRSDFACTALSVVSERMDKYLHEFSNVTPVYEYISWASMHYQSLLEHLADSTLVAQDPDYFGFAKIIFADVTSGAVSTSKVDPHWYDSPGCVDYIEFQRKMVVEAGKEYTRIFFISSDDKKETRAKLKQIIAQQVSDGFRVIVVPTNDYNSERDVAVIDGGRLVMRAVVDTADGRPIAEINGCYCYVRSKTASPLAKHEMAIVMGYVQQLLKKAIKQFDPRAFREADLQDLWHDEPKTLE